MLLNQDDLGTEVFLTSEINRLDIENDSWPTTIFGFVYPRVSASVRAEKPCGAGRDEHVHRYYQYPRYHLGIKLLVI
jgi:hypothetical protein